MEDLTRETMKKEAVSWMEILGIKQEAIDDFKNYDTVMSCRGINGTFVTPSEGLKELIRQVEHKYGCLVYFVVETDTLFGHLDSLLFVTKYSEEWEMSREMLKDGYALTYTHNRDFPECSEMGDIVVKTTSKGGLIRLG